MVGATGFEPATSCSRSRRSTGLSYAPPNRRSIASHDDAPGRTRTSNLLIRSQMLYPIELRAPTSPSDRRSGARMHDDALSSASCAVKESTRDGKLSQASVIDVADDRAWCRHFRSLQERGKQARSDSTGDSMNAKMPQRFSLRRMGGTRLELVTSTMSTWRSNQLS